jgi:hypothetical protein
MASMKRNRPSFRNRVRRDWKLDNLADPSHPRYDEDRIVGHDVVVGDFVKIDFLLAGTRYSESMWIRVTSVRGRLFGGRLESYPWVVNARHGDYVNFTDANILFHEDANGDRKVVVYDQDLPLAA